MSPTPRRWLGLLLSTLLVLLFMAIALAFLQMAGGWGRWSLERNRFIDLNRDGTFATEGTNIGRGLGVPGLDGTYSIDGNEITFKFALGRQIAVEKAQYARPWPWIVQINGQDYTSWAWFGWCALSIVAGALALPLAVTLFGLAPPDDVDEPSHQEAAASGGKKAAIMLALALAFVLLLMLYGIGQYFFSLPAGAAPPTMSQRGACVILGSLTGTVVQLVAVIALWTRSVRFIGALALLASLMFGASFGFEAWDAGSRLYAMPVLDWGKVDFYLALPWLVLGAIVAFANYVAAVLTLRHLACDWVATESDDEEDDEDAEEDEDG